MGDPWSPSPSPSQLQAARFSALSQLSFQAYSWAGCPGRNEPVSKGGRSFLPWLPTAILPKLFGDLPLMWHQHPSPLYHQARFRSRERLKEFEEGHGTEKRKELGEKGLEERKQGWRVTQVHTCPYGCPTPHAFQCHGIFPSPSCRLIPRKQQEGAWW